MLFDISFDYYGIIEDIICVHKTWIYLQPTEAVFF